MNTKWQALDATRAKEPQLTWGKPCWGVGADVGCRVNETDQARIRSRGGLYFIHFRFILSLGSLLYYIHIFKQ